MCVCAPRRTHVCCTYIMYVVHVYVVCLYESYVLVSLVGVWYTAQQLLLQILQWINISTTHYGNMYIHAPSDVQDIAVAPQDTQP